MTRLDEQTLELILSSLREYGRWNLSDEVVLSLDEDDVFPEQVLADLYDPEQIGLHLLFVPECYGGLGAGAHDVYRVAETLAGIDLGISTAVLATFLGTDPISVGGTDGQKERWMRRIADEGLLVAYGATEPQAGSDLGALRTTAVPVLEQGQIQGYRLTGRKQWISNGGVASLYTILAKAPGGPSWFVVERGAEGLTAGKPERKHGLRASNTTALFLDDVLVPADHLIGEVEGRGLSQAQAVFGFTRLMVAAFGLGAGWAALKRAVRYSQERYQGGSLLCDKQGFTHKLLVPNAVRLEAARAMIEHTAARLDAGERGLNTEGAIAKYLASEAGNRAAEDAIQALGGYGYTREYMVEKIKRDVRITTIYEGTSEILESTIARDRWQAHLKSRGQFHGDWAARLEAAGSAVADMGAETASAARQPAEGRSTEADTGVAAASLALKLLGRLLERCRQGRLTRHQHVLMRLGEFIAQAEAAAVFCVRAAEHQSPAIDLDRPTVAAMARIYAGEALERVAWDGLRLVVGAGQADPLWVQSLGLDEVVQRQQGWVHDMDQVARRLRDALR